jgi:hypothetical protein
MDVWFELFAPLRSNGRQIGGRSPIPARLFLHQTTGSPSDFVDLGSEMQSIQLDVSL